MHLAYKEKGELTIEQFTVNGSNIRRQLNHPNLCLGPLKKHFRAEKQKFSRLHVFNTSFNQRFVQVTSFKPGVMWRFKLWHGFICSEAEKEKVLVKKNNQLSVQGNDLDRQLDCLLCDKLLISIPDGMLINV